MLMFPVLNLQWTVRQNRQYRSMALTFIMIFVHDYMVVV